MTSNQAKNHWLESAAHDAESIQSLYASKSYHWCLFFWQLRLEKLLKAVLTFQQKEIPYTHNLTILARNAEIQLLQADITKLNEISAFNLEARYDDYKFTFYKKSTKQFADTWIETCKKWEQKINSLL